MLATLGPVTFEASADLLRTFDDLKRTGGARWHEHEVHLGLPRSEFLGPGLSEFSFSIRLDIDRGVIPRDELRALREQRDLGLVMQFVIGGELVGDYTLRSMSEDLRRFDAKGVLTTAIVEMTLREYQ